MSSKTRCAVGLTLFVPALTAIRAGAIGGPGVVLEGILVALALALKLPRLLLAQPQAVIQQSGIHAAPLEWPFTLSLLVSHLFAIMAIRVAPSAMAIAVLCAAVGSAIMNDAYGTTAGVDPARVVLAGVAGAGPREWRGDAGCIDIKVQDPPPADVDDWPAVLDQVDDMLSRTSHDLGFQRVWNKNVPNADYVYFLATTRRHFVKLPQEEMDRARAERHYFDPSAQLEESAADRYIKQVILEETGVEGGPFHTVIWVD
ncbi:hypothetical protein ACG7TL_006701 [Trametes sanguinea]